MTGQFGRVLDRRPHGGVNEANERLVEADFVLHRGTRLVEHLERLGSGRTGHGVTFGDRQTCQFGQAVRVDLRHHAGAHEFAEHLTGEVGNAGLVLVLAVELERTGAVHSQRIRLIADRYRALNKTGVAIIITQPRQLHFGEQHRFGAHELGAQNVVGKETGNGTLHEQFVELARQFFTKFQSIDSHFCFSFSRFDLFFPRALRRRSLIDLAAPHLFTSSFLSRPLYLK